MIKDTRILVARHIEDDGSFWALPGDWMKPGETLTETAVRELREETSLELEVLGLLYADDVFSEDDMTRGLQLIYSADIVGEEIHPNPEGKYLGVEYVELERLTEGNFKPYLVVKDFRDYSILLSSLQRTIENKGQEIFLKYG